MIICYSLTDFERELDSLPNDCKIGFVPTMGALHQGHISLVQNALTRTKYVVVSIFVNPTQFNNPNDLKHYPRTIESDCKMLEEAGASIVFIPRIEDIYPESKFESHNFDFGGLDKTGEGPRRPGHFNGVAQVVTRLFNIVKPTFAFFGEKDFQQLSIIKHFTKKLNYPIEIIACPILREKDGLAMSSRNMLLSPERREAAPEIFKILSASQQIIKNNYISISPSKLTEWVTKEINKRPLLKVEYVEIVNSLTLQIVSFWEEAEDIQLCTAVFAGEVRLIDNIKLK